LIISKIRLENFRGFKNFDLEMHPKLTIIAGINGLGKTTLTSAARLILWSYVRNYGDDVRHGIVPKIELDDVHCFQTETSERELKFPCSVKGIFNFPDGDGFGYFDEDFDDEFAFDIVGCELKSENSKIKWLHANSVDLEATKKGMDAAFEDLDRLLGEESRPTNLPVVACYGTNRLWRKHATPRKSARTTHRFVGYDGAVNLNSHYFKFEWFIFLILAFENRESAALLLLSVKEAILTVTNWELLLPQKGNKDILFKLGKEKMKLSQLGDGVRSMIELVGDLACRCALLNSYYKKDAVKKTSGVVLIDEIDMHLHPRWQQTILKQLQDAFPKIQFIVTTHSPQVLSTVRRENIRLLERDASGQVSANEPLARTYGEPSGDILHSVMQVDPQPPVAEKADLQRLTELVDKGLYDEPQALQLARELSLSLGEQHPQMQRLKRSIARQKVLKG